MTIKFSISNIAWDKSEDEKVYELMQKHGFEGLEIAPTRIFLRNPYGHLNEAALWSDTLKKEYGLTISSMQSIWYGITDRLFGSVEERERLLAYTKKAINFAERIGCHNIVFGCPRNRTLHDNDDVSVAIPFFRELGDYAAIHNTVLAMEANPPIYNTNYINDTAAALDLIKHVNSSGFLLNLDVGTMLQNGETVSQLEGNAKYINHVHISEPHLAPIRERNLHKELKRFLINCGYKGYVSVEMGKADEIAMIERNMSYVEKIFRKG